MPVVIATRTPIEIYDKTGIVPGTRVRIQNQGRTEVRIFDGNTPPDDVSEFWLLASLAREIFAGLTITVIGPNYGSHPLVIHEVTSTDTDVIDVTL